MSTNFSRRSTHFPRVTALFAAITLTTACGGLDPDTWRAVDTLVVDNDFVEDIASDDHVAVEDDHLEDEVFEEEVIEEEIVEEEAVEVDDRYMCIDGFGDSVVGASCGVDSRCRDGNVVLEDTSCIVPTSEFICVDSKGEPIPGGTCGEDKRCRDENGLIIEGSQCIEVPQCVEEILDFDLDANGETIQPGQDLSNAYADWGIHLETWDRNRCHPSLGIAFDSADPTGGDFDLGTPNEAFGGPGWGEGGATTNMNSLFNVLIRAENKKDRNRDGLVDNPDDHAEGGLFQFDFDGARCVTMVELLDIEESEVPALIKLFDDQGQLIDRIEAGGLGNNSVEQVAVDVCDVHSMQIRIRSSGAVSQVSLQNCNGGQPLVQ